MTGFSEEELGRLRSETPAWGAFAHFAHGSASLPPLPVFQALQTWLDDERRLGTHRAMDRHAGSLADVKASVARLINAEAGHIALLDSASHAWSAALGAVLASGGPVHVITTDLEYGANAIFVLTAARQHRLSYSLLRIGRTGALPDAELDRLLDGVPAGATPVVCVAAVSAAWGVRLALGDVARKVHDKGGLLFLDASHVVGQLPVDVAALDCDVLVFPSRKWLRGPKGMGVLFLSDRALAYARIPSAPDVAGARWVDATEVEIHRDARRFDGYEFNPGLRLALGAACDYALATGIERIACTNRQVTARVEAVLHERFGWLPFEAGQERATALMTYPVPGREVDKDGFLKRLWAAGVNATIVGRQHALWALESVGAPALVRLTPHYLTSDEEIGRLADGIAAAGVKV